MTNQGEGMKEELQGKLVEILTSIQTAAGKASDFAMDQLPDIAQSYVAFGRVSLTLYVVLSLLAIVGAPLIAWRVNKGLDEYAQGIPFIPAAGVAVGGVLVLSTTLNPALLVWFAPKVWLLKEIATLLK
jgi:hypothetical protein